MQNVQQFVYTALTNPMDVTFSMRLKMLFHFALLSFYQHVLCIQNNIFIGSIHNPPVSCFVIREERHGVHVFVYVFLVYCIQATCYLGFATAMQMHTSSNIFARINVIVPYFKFSHMYVSPLCTHIYAPQRITAIRCIYFRLFCHAIFQ